MKFKSKYYFPYKSKITKILGKNLKKKKILNIFKEILCLKYFL